MKLSPDQVRHVATLARLALTPEELAKTQAQLSAILDAVDALAQVDTEGVPATTVLAQAKAPRPDEVQGQLPVDEALRGAPKAVGSSFALPKVIE
jgi:aspartyl-tRNA(Asn)/glutamyl-tRNA(Gln) amidotransferase subunit C